MDPVSKPYHAYEATSRFSGNKILVMHDICTSPLPIYHVSTYTLEILHILQYDTHLKDANLE